MDNNWLNKYTKSADCRLLKSYISGDTGFGHGVKLITEQ